MTPWRFMPALLALSLLAQAPVSAATRISIDARDTELSDIIRMIGMQSGYNVVADGSIRQQKITFRLRDVEPEAALATLAQAYNLQTHRDGRVILVGEAASMNRRYAEPSGVGSPETEIVPLVRAKPEDVATALTATMPPGTVAVGDKRTSSVIITTTSASMPRARRIVAALDVPAFAGALPAAGATVTESVPLQNVKPSEAAKALKTALPESALVADDRANSVVITGSSDIVASARALLAALDTPSRQVMFEVRVADVKPVDDNSNVGIEFGGLTYGTGALGQVPYTITKSSIVVNAQVNTLVQNGRAQILATPRIATINNKEASILVGEQYPVVTVNQQTGYPTVQTIDVGVRLRLTPTIGSDGTITAEMHPEYSQIIGFNANYPIIANRKVDSTLRVRDGETIVLGGLFQEISSETVTKLPFLGDIPALGTFFRNKQLAHSRDEVVFFITPHVL